VFGGLSSHSNLGGQFPDILTSKKSYSVRWGILPQIPHRGILPQAPLKKNYEGYGHSETGSRKP